MKVWTVNVSNLERTRRELLLYSQYSSRRAKPPYITSQTSHTQIRVTQSGLKKAPARPSVQTRHWHKIKNLSKIRRMTKAWDMSFSTSAPQQKTHQLSDVFERPPPVLLLDCELRCCCVRMCKKQSWSGHSAGFTLLRTSNFCLLFHLPWSEQGAVCCYDTQARAGRWGGVLYSFAEKSHEITPHDQYVLDYASSDS